MKNNYRFILKIIANLMMLFTLGVNYAIAAPSYEPTAASIRVAINGVDSNGCGSEIQPCRTIQYAVNKAATGDIILVASGTYTYAPEYNVCTFLNTPSVVCYVNKNLTIIGGYTSADWYHSNPQANPTIIDGQGKWRGVAVIAYNSPAELTMQGFTILNGRAFGKTSGDDYFRIGFGGGLYAQCGSVHLKDMIFSKNIAYGGSNQDVSVGGWALGGALALEGPQHGNTSSLENLTFIENQAIAGDGKDGGGISEGGAVFISNATVTGTGLTLTGNIARGGNTSGSGINPASGLPADSMGGGIAIENNSNINFSNLVATNNKAIGGNAGNASQARAGSGLGGAMQSELSTLILTDALLNSNVAIGGVAATGGIAMGGGIIADTSQATFNRVKFLSNSAASGSSSTGGKVGQVGGGGAYLVSFTETGDYHASLTNCLFANNSISLGASGQANSGSGGAMVIQAITVDINHATFADNQLGVNLYSGQAIAVQGLYGASGKPGRLNLNYSIISDHRNAHTTYTSALTNLPGSTASLNYVWFGNNTNHTNENSQPLPPGTFNLANVWKETSTTGYVSPGSPDYDYHLRSDSPVIDRGFNSTIRIDLDHNPRPVGVTEDLGAYEYSVPTLIASQGELYFITDADQIITLQNLISVRPGPDTEWTAATNADWVYLGSSGTSSKTTGLTGTDLTVRLDPSKLNLGTHTAAISVTSPTADPVTINVTLLKVEELQRVYMPITIR